MNRGDFTEKIRKFLTSDWFTVLLLAAASVFILTGSEIIGTVIFIVILGLVMLMTDDLIPALQIIVITSCFAIRCKHSYDDFIQFAFMIPPVAIMILSHFIIYRSGFRKGSLLKGIIATSLAVTLGGVGIISAKEYFSLTSLFYIFMLGFATLIIYMYMNGALKMRKDYVFSDRFAKLMVSIIIMLCICLAEEYLSRANELSEGFDILPFQWRNNGSTLLMLAMPFAFYLSAKKFGYFFIGILSYVAILFTGSRGGMLFGLVELGICFVIMFFVDKKHRPLIGAIFGVALVVAFLLRNAIFDIVSYTVLRLISPSENEIRLQLIGRGIEDFKANPIFGRGIGYMGNNDVHHNAEFTLCWYHCSPIQIIGSFGIVGVAAYLFLFIEKIRTLVKNFTFFNLMIFASYIGLELMSLVNPGIFVPFPYLFMITIYFVIMEKCNSYDDKKQLSLLVHGGRR